MKTFYLPIKASNLGQYFSKGLISPSKYIEDRIEDVQKKYNEFLFLSDKIVSVDTDCCLEIVFAPNEEPKFLSENFFIYDKPLPISRVKNIIFQSEQQKNTTIGLITLSTAFIPNDLVSISSFENISISDLPILNEITNSWSEQIKKYNNRLGGLALMRTARDEGMNYSNNYFQTLAMYSKTIESELINAKQNTKTIFQNLFHQGERQKYFLSSLSKKIDANEINEMAKIEKQVIVKDKLTGRTDYNKLDGDTYILSILGNFGVSNEVRENKIDSLILSNFREGIKYDKAEEVALCFGINRGYAVFPAFYKLGPKQVNVKFELSSQLDYYTIESVYQFIFNNQSLSDGFPYLDKWCPSLNKKITKNSFQILDEVVLQKKSPEISSKEYTDLLLNTFKGQGSTMFIDVFKYYYIKDIENLIQSIIDKSKNEIELLYNEINNLNKTNKDLSDGLENINNSKSSKKLRIDIIPNAPLSNNNFDENLSRYNNDEYLDIFINLYELKAADFNKIKKECEVNPKIKNKRLIINEIISKINNNSLLKDKLNL